MRVHAALHTPDPRGRSRRPRQLLPALPYLLHPWGRASRGTRTFLCVAGMSFMGTLAALRPAQGELHGGARLIFRGRIRGALVEDHNNVRAERLLHGHGLLRPHEYAITVHRRLEGHTLLADYSEFPQAPHLKPA